MSGQDVIETRIQLNVILVQIGVELLRAQDFRNADQLIVVVVTVEERFFAEYHRSQHTSERPHVQRVIVHLIIDEQLRPFEVTAGYSNVVLLTGMVELGKAPIDQTKLAIFVVNHNVMWLDVAMHDPHTMAVVQRFEQLVQIESYVVVGQRLIQLLEVCIVDVLEDERRCPRYWVFHDGEQCDDICTTA